MQIRFHRLLLLAGFIFCAAAAYAQVSVAVTIAPPPLPVYDQPLCPGDGYIWTPGYWAWDGDYYWVPGTWIMYPEAGFLWTPGYWAWRDNGFYFIEGYWAPTIGFYGGINYGFGYFGHGFDGGRWDSGHFDYNTAVNRVDTRTIHNVYSIPVNVAVNRVSYNGGKGGINVSPSEQEQSDALIAGSRIGPTSTQLQHEWASKNDPKQRYAANHGAPPLMATALPRTAVHPRDLPPIAKPAPPQTGNAQLDQKYQKEQEQLIAKQNQDRQKLQEKQEKEDQQVKQKGDAAKTQQLEQQHHVQTQQLQQSHMRQMQQLQQKQPGGQSGGGRR